MDSSGQVADARRLVSANTTVTLGIPHCAAWSSAVRVGGRGRRRAGRRQLRRGVAAGRHRARRIAAPKGERGVVAAVGLRRDQLCRGNGLHPVLEEEPGKSGPRGVPPVPGTTDPALVLDREQLDRAAGLVGDPHPPLVLIERPVHLDVLAGGEPHDAPRLVPVQDQLAILALQAEAGALGHPERQEGCDDQQQPADIGDGVDRQPEVRGDDVVGAGEDQDAEGGQDRDADGGANRRVPGPVGDVVLTPIAGHVRLEERVRRQCGEQQAGQHHRRDQHIHRDREPTDHPLHALAGHQSQRTLQEEHVPVRLGSRGDRRGVVRPVVPHRVDRHRRAHQRQDAEDDEEEAAGLGHVHREEREPDDVALGPAGQPVMGVLVQDNEEEVQPDQRKDQARDQQDVHGEQAGDDGVPGELTAEDEVRQVAADDRDRLDYTVGDPQTVAGQDVVRQGVAGEPGGDAEDHQGEPDQPVDLARLAERPGEEHPHHVRDDRSDEHHGGPVMDLPHQQTAGDLEGQGHRRPEGLGHLHALHRGERPVVGDLAHARDEEQGQEDAGDQQHQERVQRDLTEHEGPVVGEHLPGERLDRQADPGALVEVVGSGGAAATADYLDQRTGIGLAVKAFARKVFPDHWSFLLGEIALYSFLVLLITGVFLTLFFVPSMGQVTYDGPFAPMHGVQMSEAFRSTMALSFEVTGGLLMRQIHHWAAVVFIAAIVTHMMRVFFTGAFRKPREVNWLVGFTLMILGIAAGFSGYSLPDDVLSGNGLRITDGVVKSIPIIGSYLSYFIFGGEFPGDAIVPRLFTVHVLLVPGLILALIGLHLFFVVLHKHTHYGLPGRTERNVVGFPFFPVYVAKAGGFFFIVFGVLALMGATMTINPVWNYGPYDPSPVSAGAQPDWYMLFLEGALRLMPGQGMEWVIGGFTIPMNVLVPAVVLPGLLFTALAAYPFLEAYVTGDRREHHIAGTRVPGPVGDVVLT